MRHRYSVYDPKKYGFACKDESRTQQQFKDECDVNNILAKYRRTNMLTHINKHQGNFGDFANVEDYQQSMGKVLQAQESFDSLPSELRSKFQNDPANLIAFLSDEKNDVEAVKLGLRVLKQKNPSLREEFEVALSNNDKKRNASDLNTSNKARKNKEND